MPPAAPRSGDAIFASVERVDLFISFIAVVFRESKRDFMMEGSVLELFTLTYGAIVRQLLTDLEEVE
ncbi:hypothetical protein Golob_015241, partial [Gossypium lobatum]|nr:hypothetical protein [Gossypium lobatum]